MIANVHGKFLNAAGLSVAMMMDEQPQGRSIPKTMRVVSV
jgi:hypothetical protein